MITARHAFIFLIILTATLGSMTVLAVLFSLVTQLYRLVRLERSLSLTMREREPNRRLTSFRLTDPYAVPGLFRRGQLHAHTRESSRDASMPLADVIIAYRELGYDFLAVTDHNHFFMPDDSPLPGFVLIPGSEDSYPWRWLGHHYLCLHSQVCQPRNRGNLRERFMSVTAAQGLVGLAHPSWRGGLGLGRWLPQDVPEVEAPFLLEISSPYANSIRENTLLWHYLLNASPPRTVWAIATDDLHRQGGLNRGWVMVKTERLTAAAILDALRRGNFYASTGPDADFGVLNGAVFARTTAPCTIRFTDSRNCVRAAARAVDLAYVPRGDEGFIRVEAEDANGGTAWSQPFFLSPE